MEFRFDRRQLIVAGALLPLAAHAQPGLVEGRDYKAVNPPQPTESGNKIEVLEFFSYGCPHCGEFEPILQNWLKTVPADVAFHRVPVIFQDRWVPLAKEYYTLEALGEDARLSPEMFTAIHGKGTNMSSEKTFFDWAAAHGIDRKKVEDMYNSFAIAGKMNRARQMAQSYSVQSVPLIVIDGKFVVVEPDRTIIAPPAWDLSSRP